MWKLHCKWTDMTWREVIWYRERYNKLKELEMNQKIVNSLMWGELYNRETSFEGLHDIAPVIITEYSMHITENSG
jgi:hypothetical protein